MGLLPVLSSVLSLPGPQKVLVLVSQTLWKCMHLCWAPHDMDMCNMPAIGASERMSHTSSLAEVQSFFGDCLWGWGGAVHQGEAA